MSDELYDQVQHVARSVREARRERSELYDQVQALRTEVRELRELVHQVLGNVTVLNARADDLTARATAIERNELARVAAEAERPDAHDVRR